MRILMCHAAYAQPSGEDHSFDLEAKLLEANGHQVQRLVWSNREITSWSAAVRQIYSRLVWSWMTEAIYDFQPDVVHFQNLYWSLGPTAIEAAAACKVPIVAAVRNERLRMGWRDVIGRPYAGTRAQALAAAVGNLVHLQTWRQRVDVMLCVSEYIARSMRGLGFAPDQVMVKPNLAAWPELPADENEPAPQCLFAGRICKEKGIFDLLEAWRMLGAEAPRLLVAGRMPAEFPPYRSPHMPARSDMVTFLGDVPHDELLQLMGESMLVIVPSRWPEPFGRTAIEALMMGTDTLVTDVGGLAETKPSLMIQAGRPEAIAEIIGTFSRLSPMALTQSRMAARRRYETYFAPRFVLKGFEEAYARAVASA